MKTFQIASIVALASVATAQLDNIPSCALNCFVGPLTTDGCSSLTDFACHCKQGASLLGKVQPCVQGACTADDQAATISAVEETCNGAGVPIVIPSAGSVVASATSAAASAASSAQAEASSAVEAASSAVASAASSLAGVVTSAIASATGNSTVSAMPTPSASVSQFTGGAPQATGAAVLLGAAAFAMLL